MSSDQSIDPNDPLSLLLDSSMDESNSSSSENGATGGPQDWSQLSSLWAGSDPSKDYPELMDFGELNSLPMDMDFNPALGMEPGALNYNYNPMHLGGSFDDPTGFHGISPEMIPPQFAFTFQQALLNAGVNNSSFPSSSSTSSLSSPESNNKERRLSVTSSASSSGASLSPVLESLASPSSSYGSAASPSPVKAEAGPGAAKPLDPAAELAERVRQSAGVMLAVPMSADLSSQVLAHSMAAGNSNRLAIPQQTHTQPRSPISSSSSAASTPPPTTPPMPTSLNSKLNLSKPISSSSSASPSTLATPIAGAPPALVGISGRPKTSHTTIERRYRTNLNARIQSLRMAVPALRVLEDSPSPSSNSNSKKIKKNLKDGVYVKGAGIGIEAEDGQSVDVIDERGFVDGVKVARKCSKANVLGKAVEYIRVLKKREIRLKNEQEGLKALISGLVGGPALLKDWEIRWREKFGGEERDEVEGEEEMDDSDDEDGEDDEEVGKKRKRAKTGAPVKKAASVSKPAAPAAPSGLAELAPGGVVPEKRKRGRPRKVVPPPMPVATLAPHVAAPPPSVPMAQQAMHPEQMMQHHAAPSAPQYMMAVFALFSFFNSPLTSSYTSSGTHGHKGMVLTPPLALAPEIVSSLVPPPSESPSSILAIAGWKDYIQVVHLAVSVLVIGSFLWSWLGFTFRKRKDAAATPTVQTPVNGKVNWAAVVDDAVLQGKSNSLSILSLVRSYSSLQSSTSSLSNLTSLSLLLNAITSGPLVFITRTQALSAWSQSKKRAALIHTARSSTPPAKEFEKLVFESFSTADEASKAIASASPRDKSNGERMFTPIEVLGASLVKQRVKQHLGALFVEVVSISQDDIVEQDKEESVKDVETEIRRTIEASAELGGDIEELGRTLERVWKSTSPAALEDLALSASSEEREECGIDGEIRSLLTALVLYKKMFSGSNTPTVTSLLISPPPSPTTTTSAVLGKTKEGEALLELRRALGSRVFEDVEGGCIEDARDKVVDLIVDTERRVKGVW